MIFFALNEVFLDFFTGSSGPFGFDVLISKCTLSSYNTRRQMGHQKRQSCDFDVITRVFFRHLSVMTETIDRYKLVTLTSLKFPTGNQDDVKNQHIKIT